MSSSYLDRINVSNVRRRPILDRKYQQIHRRKHTDYFAGSSGRYARRSQHDRRGVVCRNLTLLRRLHHLTSARQRYHRQRQTSLASARLHARLVLGNNSHARHEEFLVLHALPFPRRSNRRSLSPSRISHDQFVVHERRVSA